MLIKTKTNRNCSIIYVLNTFKNEIPLIATVFKLSNVFYFQCIDFFMTKASNKYANDFHDQKRIHIIVDFVQNQKNNNFAACLRLPHCTQLVCHS